MSEDELAELIRDCPVLYHMAARGSWPSIRCHGLLSTSAVLDLFGVEGEAREAIEERRRAGSVEVERAELGTAVIRDQKPMSDAALRRCLDDGLVPADWYRTLNARAFFCLTRKRLLRLLTAGSYRNDAHDVLHVDTASLVRAHRPRITLSPINSGFAQRFAARRGRDTFQAIPDYPYAGWRGKRPRGERVVELAVAPGVPDIARHTRRVVAMRGEEELETVWSAPER
ncbi:hypothetical protein [Aureimonas sp. ME7]|uniref:DUF7002 family protein n=1 Tax=Aureimonas sp. ME7 TaxID=2744252 RepID=UPI0015F47BA7|nr:hypothetical protein [Aureimonas sp. ME7]